MEQEDKMEFGPVLGAPLLSALKILEVLSQTVVQKDPFWYGVQKKRLKKVHLEV
jgi:hypothetical protein